MKKTMSVPGVKADEGKPRWSLLPQGVMGDVVAVLEHGAKKYGVDNWQRVEGADHRYYSAAMRHLDAWWSQGEYRDKESGLPHLSHAICCLLFLAWQDRQDGR